MVEEADQLGRHLLRFGAVRLVQRFKFFLNLVDQHFLSFEKCEHRITGFFFRKARQHLQIMLHLGDICRGWAVQFRHETGARLFYGFDFLLHWLVIALLEGVSKRANLVLGKRVLVGGFDH